MAATAKKVPPAASVIGPAERIACRVDRLQRINWPDDQRPTLYDMIVSSVRLVEFEPVAYCGFQIKPIDHSAQPFWLDAAWVTDGFIAISDTQGHCMPGAVWFRTVDDAKAGVDAYMLEKLDVGRDHAAVQRFHRRLAKHVVSHGGRCADGLPDDATVALLVGEWVQFGDGGPSWRGCPCCSVDRDKIQHANGCVHDRALSKAGYRTQKQRDDARARIRDGA
jgi:hypothetical protein